jgi:phosphoribosyl 1,2-cyclic phosphodiesterase
MKIFPLFSGSSGNSTYIESYGTAILIDIGCSTKKVETILKDNDIDPKNIKSIFITHEHIDHVRGLKTFAKRYHTKVYSSEGTIDALKKKRILDEKIQDEIITEEGISLGNISVKPFHTSHDSRESLGYVVNIDDKKNVAIATDMGYISDTVFDAISGCKTIFIESNHDVGMLENGPYPYFLKKRILSKKGHLSNEACAEVLPGLVKSGTQRFILSHLSEHNNFPELAYRASLLSLTQVGMKQNIDFEISVASKENSKGIIFN